MESRIFLDTVGQNVDFIDERQYNAELVLPKQSISKIEKKDEVKFFGLSLCCKEVLSVVNTLPIIRKEFTKVTMHLDNITEQVEKVVENSSTWKLANMKRNTVLNISPELKVRLDNCTKQSRLAMTSNVDQRIAHPTVEKIHNKLKRSKAKSSKTKGGDWAYFPASEVTEGMRNELKIIQMRSVLNPKQFYKKNDRKCLPTFFQIGTVQHSALEHDEEKKARKNMSLVNELLEDKSFQIFNKRIFNDVTQHTDKSKKYNKY
ncbi:uncharacterized protein LOC108109613 [Drosophila eugracilis]|uniref:uncharacterized protein LOC108109613 n=1 Tax=Drosophila eugracilis TaxID=29029 RepID=UPI0007E82C31|nr:uncharacterized protein LOC108109613 [Drosophila eugracilis]